MDGGAGRKICGFLCGLSAKDEEWYDKKRKSISDAIDKKSDDYIHSDSERYNLILHNCQDYIDEVLRLAKFIAIQNNDSLEFE